MLLELIITTNMSSKEWGGPEAFTSEYLRGVDREETLFNVVCDECDFRTFHPMEFDIASLVAIGHSRLTNHAPNLVEQDIDHDGNNTTPATREIRAGSSDTKA